MDIQPTVVRSAAGDSLSRLSAPYKWRDGSGHDGAWGQGPDALDRLRAVADGAVAVARAACARSAATGVAQAARLLAEYNWCVSSVCVLRRKRTSRADGRWWRRLSTFSRADEAAAPTVAGVWERELRRAVESLRLLEASLLAEQGTRTAPEVARPALTRVLPRARADEHSAAVWRRFDSKLSETTAAAVSLKESVRGPPAHAHTHTHSSGERTPRHFCFQRRLRRSRQRIQLTQLQSLFPGD